MDVAEGSVESVQNIVYYPAPRLDAGTTLVQRIQSYQERIHVYLPF
jgi:hypothetical protein